jgi:23S rRNA (pseudouridine1915-N3)-methyltransferase
MKHELLCLGKIKEKFLAEGVAEYIGRLRHYTDFTLTMLKDRSKAATPGGVVEAEGRALLQAVSPGALVVALDPGGRQMSTEAFTNSSIPGKCGASNRSVISSAVPTGMLNW